MNVNNRALNAENDIFLLNSQIARVTLGAQVVQLVRSRLLFYQGEGIFDTTVGTPWLQKIMGKTVNLPLTESLIKSRISTTDGVQQVIKFLLDFDPRERGLTVTFTASTVYGEIIEDELYINI